MRRGGGKRRDDTGKGSLEWAVNCPVQEKEEGQGRTEKEKGQSAYSLYAMIDMQLTLLA